MKRKKTAELWWKSYTEPIHVLEIYWPGFARDISSATALLRAWKFNLKKFDKNGGFKEFEKNRGAETWPRENLRSIFIDVIQELENK